MRASTPSPPFIFFASSIISILAVRATQEARRHQQPPRDIAMHQCDNTSTSPFKPHQQLHLDDAIRTYATLFLCGIALWLFYQVACVTHGLTRGVIWLPAAR
jgi:hypothetical protein